MEPGMQEKLAIVVLWPVLIAWAAMCIIAFVVASPLLLCDRDIEF